MRRFSRLLLLATGLAALSVLAGCASGPQVDPQITAALTARGVNATTYGKIYNARPLDYDDIKDLVVKKVPTQIIVSYLESTRRVYHFSYSQLNALRSAGAAPQLLNYLSETQGFYGYNPPGASLRSKKGPKDAYLHSPLYQDEQPFAYSEPEVDDWYDSGYEESLYSPFSMD